MNKSRAVPNRPTLINITGSIEVQSIPNYRKNKISFYRTPRVFFIILKSLTSSGQHRCVQRQHIFRLHGLEKSSVCAPFTPSRGFPLILILFYEHISILTWAKERANPCNSVQFSIRANENGHHCGHVSGRKRSVFMWGRSGWERQQLGFTAVRKQRQRAPCKLFRAADRLLGGTLWTASNCGETPKGLFLRENAVHMEGHFLQVLYFPDGVSLSVKWILEAPSQDPLPCPPQPRSAVH